MHVRGAALLLDLPRHVLELLARARDQEHGAARLADPQRGLQADARGRPGDHHALVLDGRGQRAVPEQRRVHVALPVVPQLARVGVQRGHRDAGAGQGALGVARVERALEVAHLHRRRRDAQVAVDLVADLLDRGQGHDPGADRVGHRLGQVLVHAHGHLRRVGRAGEGVQGPAGGHRVGVDQVEGVARQVLVGQVADVVHGLGHEVHRHDRRLPALGAGQREPRGQRAAQLLEQVEHVVRAVDLVHDARLGVAHDHARAVDQRLRLDVAPDHRLGLVLGPVVVVGQLLVLVEHVLLEHALVGAGHGDRADVVEAADVVGVGELDHVAGALDVGLLGRVLVGLHVVDGGQVEQVVDLLREVLDAQLVLEQVAGDGDDPALVGAQVLDQRVDLPARALAHQHVDGPVALQQLLDEVAPDETGRAGDEVVHSEASLFPLWPARAYPARSQGCAGVRGVSPQCDIPRVK